MSIALRPEWLYLLVGVVLVNGITEEVIHRGFVFGHMRPGRSFAAAVTLSAMVFAAQHLYIIVTTGWTVGLASVMLAALLAYPLAFVFERGGNSIEVRVPFVDPRCARPRRDDSLDLAVEDQGLDLAVGRLE